MSFMQNTLYNNRLLTTANWFFFIPSTCQCVTEGNSFDINSNEDALYLTALTTCLIQRFNFQEDEESEGNTFAFHSFRA